MIKHLASYEQFPTGRINVMIHHIKKEIKCVWIYIVWNIGHIRLFESLEILKWDLFHCFLFSITHPFL